ncbi:MAG: hypothetical protein R3C99_25000 [Pirellulaceae bacterium]
MGIFRDLEIQSGVIHWEKRLGSHPQQCKLGRRVINGFIAGHIRDQPTLLVQDAIHLARVFSRHPRAESKLAAVTLPHGGDSLLRP